MKSSATALYFFGRGDNDHETDKENIMAKDVANNDETATNVKKLFSFLTVAFPSFLAGTVATLSFLFLPLFLDYYDAFHPGSNGNVYGAASTGGYAPNGDGGQTGKINRNNINQPVILFETILADLNEAYVDDVDIQQLFETGVKAMTSSLDPYTEFESRAEAQELEESVTGKYGGVGLVIRGSPKSSLAMEDDEQTILNVVNSADQADSTSSSMDANEKRRSTTPPVTVKETNFFRRNSVESKLVEGDDEDDDAAERKRARRKSMQDGIRVVSAFEGENIQLRPRLISLLRSCLSTVVVGAK